MARENGPTKEEQLRWQAEDIVRETITASPQFKKEVNRTMKELRSLQRGINKNLKKKK